MDFSLDPLAEFTADAWMLNEILYMCWYRLFQSSFLTHSASVRTFASSKEWTLCNWCSVNWLYLSIVNFYKELITKYKRQNIHTKQISHWFKYIWYHWRITISSWHQSPRSFNWNLLMVETATDLSSLPTINMKNLLHTKPITQPWLDLN